MLAALISSGELTKFLHEEQLRVLMVAELWNSPVARESPLEHSRTWSLTTRCERRLLPIYYRKARPLIAEIKHRGWQRIPHPIMKQRGGIDDGNTRLALKYATGEPLIVLYPNASQTMMCVVGLKEVLGDGRLLHHCYRCHRVLGPTRTPADEVVAVCGVPGFGDRLAAWFKTLGFEQSPGCGCQERQQFVNRVHRAAYKALHP